MTPWHPSDAPDGTEALSDRQLLESLLADDRLTDSEREAFQDMLDNWIDEERQLTKKQRIWIEGKYDALELDADAGALNLASRKLVPVGRPVETPTILQALPLRPPHRMHELAEPVKRRT